MGLTEHSKRPKRHVIRVSNGKGDDIEPASRELFLTPFSSHRYNFPFQKAGFCC
jgi:hypothetical protein